LHRSDHNGRLISVVEVGYNPSPDAWTFLTNDKRSDKSDFITGDKSPLS
jgi:hypothetical protein